MEKHTDKELADSVAILKLLNKAQVISKRLHKLNADKSYLKDFDESIKTLSLLPTDIIGDTVFLNFVKKHGIRYIAEPNERGWAGISWKL